MQRNLIAVIASAPVLALAAAAPASAEAQDEYQARISYGDLNLQSDAGADALLRRVRSEARAVCGDRSGRMSISERREIRECMSDFEERAVALLDNDHVTTRFAGEDTPSIVLASR